MSRFSVIFAVSILALTGCDSASERAVQQSEEAIGPSYTPPLASPPPLPGQIVRFQAGTPMPQGSFADPAGKVLNTADLKGTPVLLNLWATWCIPCLAEMPALDALAAEMGDDLKVLTVSQDVRGAELVDPYFAQRDFTHLEPWLDPDAELNQALNAEALMPMTILFDAEGKELLRVAGGYEWDSEEAIAQIREAIGE